MTPKVSVLTGSRTSRGSQGRTSGGPGDDLETSLGGPISDPTGVRTCSGPYYFGQKDSV